MALQRDITQADLDANPILVELGGAVGNKCTISLNDDQEAAATAPQEEAPAPSEDQATQ